MVHYHDVEWYQHRHRHNLTCVSVTCLDNVYLQSRYIDIEAGKRSAKRSQELLFG